MFLRSDRPAQPPLDAAASTEETLGVSSGRPEWKKDRDGRFRVYPVHAKSERHHELRLDRRAGGAGAVGIEDVLGRVSQHVNRLERQPALTRLVDVAVDPAAIFLPRAERAGDGARARVDLPGARDETPAEVARAPLVEDPGPVEGAGAGESIEEADIVFGVGRDAAPLPAGIDRR